MKLLIIFFTLVTYANFFVKLCICNIVDCYVFFMEIKNRKLTWRSRDAYASIGILDLGFYMPAIARTLLTQAGYSHS